MRGKRSTYFSSPNQLLHGQSYQEEENFADEILDEYVHLQYAPMII